MKYHLHTNVFTIASALFISLYAISTLHSSANTAEQPALITAVAPVYPPIARAAGVSGEVSVEVNIKPDGSTINAKASTGHPLLLKAAAEAAKHWRFAPTTGTDADRSALLTFIFRLMPRCSPANELTSSFSPPYKVEARIEKAPIICDDCSPAEQENLRCSDQ